VINAALSYPESDNAKLMIIGEQGAGNLSSQGRKFVGFPGIASGECYEAALKLKDYIMEEGLTEQLHQYLSIAKPLAHIL